MNDKVNAMLELERRGKLPEQFKPILAEARRRGLVPGGEAPELGPNMYTPQNAALMGQASGQPQVDVLDPIKDDPTPVSRVMDNVVGGYLPEMSGGEKVGALLNKGGESMTFGLVGDEASAAIESLMPGVDYAKRRDHYRQQEKQIEQENPGLSIAADIGGAVLGALTPVGAIGTLGRGAGLMSRLGASTLAGAGMGATAGFMEGEGAQDRVNQGETGAVLGGALGFAAPAIGAGVQRFADSRAGNRAIREAVRRAPTSDQLRAQGRAAYKAVDDAGVSVRPDVVQSKTAEIAKMLADEGADPILTPNANRVAGRLTEAGQGANTVRFSELDKLRRIAGNAASANPANRPDTRLSNMAREGLDDMVRNLGPDDVDAGDIETLQTMLPKARDLWARMSRSQMLDDAIDASENYQSGAASGLRNQFRRIVNNKKLRQGFSDAEIKMMRRVVNGTMPEQIVNYLGSGLGMMGQMAAGGAAGSVAGPFGALGGLVAGSATAAGSRKMAENIVRKNAEIARALVASGKVPKLPVASDANRRIAEQLMRRSSTVGPQQ